MRSIVSILVAMLFFAGASLEAQEKGSTKSSSKSSSTKSDSKESTKESKEARVRGVLPQYFGKLSLSDEQRQKIYRIQNEYSDQIADLEKKIESLKAERNNKYLKELTKAQRERLEELKKGREKEKDDDNDK
ncbi:MAG TPA: hypothetical protein PKA06_00410 [Gemmatales bacterium]|mgnify:CR=1 FL=1|nr:hypothetical protein [Gemmatales bacterium]HMP18542.1 hypothetical protein [Gemmatales bacterium]